MARQLLRKTVHLRESGFTITELLTVIAIISILATIAIMSVDLIRKEAVSSENKKLLAELQRIRMAALTSGPTTSNPTFRGSGIRLISPYEYETFVFNDCNNNFSYDVNGCGGGREETSSKKSSTGGTVGIYRSEGGALVTPANDIWIFDSRGALRTTDWSIVNDRIFVVRHETAAHTRCISLTGSSIREGAWNGTTCTAL